MRGQEFLRSLPIHISGVALACISMGNYLEIYSIYLKKIFLIIGALIFLLITIRSLFYPCIVKEEINDPLKMAIMPIYIMCFIMLISLSIPLIGIKVATPLWIFGIILLVVVDIYFVFKHFIKMKLQNWFYIYWIPFISICIVPITARAFNMINLGQVFSYIAMLFCIILIPPMLYKHIKWEEVPRPMIPSKCIIAAPAAITLVGYISVNNDVNKSIVFTLGLASVLMLVISFANMFNMLQVEFYPSYTAFTFPMVISLTAIKKLDMYLASNGFIGQLVHSINILQEPITITLLLYAIFRFARHYGKILFSDPVRA